ncbi:2-amino-3,7-dideoxy-D-threo-hept-6-ulosonate synthase [Methanoculleus bourgensis]|jgi:fructose-bisphosphate aldolase/2-amino-3,7-dideoxy-D-threo-hept-6-ulosonate synthase|uniref:2-amino-3,7-dideoxy-D-threo-hept-6-ulosonate synthase n=2 Tax=Methanoculleus bourgensis TaxID=83986 RepID=I7LNB9_METBM|nr:2-amino-3,7-dideoxy-D-threo-hept-6-ulosonate synthase [Methanoculleus bourgensis]MBT0734204.1 2-amino-3,7-dideoxy-D-threo-hept-6-ulosonate synthase [Methanoculleus bourgensis]MDD3373780.1 2-amino-3,7-dideoxy-D-threo-hept-6-ulosonate synthase [Methanoculleus bourgensis]NQS78003.1 class I fructose-bisphosphate aldolase family protein [Methanoculleus bourgensis]CCJ36959.1 fructose-bisphosphate aldolase, class I [Methanoculleus bourgensis MS2]
MIGKEIRLERIMDRNTGRAVIIPMDHGFTMGQIEGLRNMTGIVSEVSEAGANAIVLHKGMVKGGHRKRGKDIGLIVHLSASTSMNPDPNDKVLVCTVEEAVALGADAVSIHINLGAPNESRMIESAGAVVRDCNRWGMPLLIMIYPRGKGIDPTSPQAIGHCVRVAEELGADLIKTTYTGDPATFRQITEACSVPVMIAGGEKGGDLETLTTIRDAIGAGAAGVCMGRNAFQREDPGRFIGSICRVVHEGASPADALERE